MVEVSYHGAGGKANDWVILAIIAAVVIGAVYLLKKSLDSTVGILAGDVDKVVTVGTDLTRSAGNTVIGTTQRAVDVVFRPIEGVEQFFDDAYDNLAAGFHKYLW